MSGSGTKPTAVTTAGVRGAFWNPKFLPAAAKFDSALVQCADGASCQGVLAYCGDETVVAMGMHPREYLPNNYMVPGFLDAGIAMWTQAPRSIGNDLRLEHETALLDVAAGIEHLRDRGYKKIVLVGMSGGASLFSFYLQQANLPAAHRLAKTPAGRPTKLQQVELPVPDGVVFVSPHPGQGILLMNSIDPSVIDENDPMQTDASLDPFSTSNGFRAPPESSSYAKEFVARYRKAQRARVARIDDWARSVVHDRVAARRKAKESRDIDLLKLSAHTPIITIWRTDADLRCFDLSIEPTTRAYGSLWGANPFASNYGSIGFGRTCTADSWLSTWSGLSSRAAMVETAAGITQPTLVVRYDGDNSVFPSETQAIFDAIPATDKQYEILLGNHHGRAVQIGDPDGQTQANNIMTNWVNARFVG